MLGHKSVNDVKTRKKKRIKSINIMVNEIKMMIETASLQKYIIFFLTMINNTINTNTYEIYRKLFVVTY